MDLRFYKMLESLKGLIEITDSHVDEGYQSVPKSIDCDYVLFVLQVDQLIVIFESFVGFCPFFYLSFCSWKSLLEGQHNLNRFHF